jgi:hypothetical protein
MISVGLLGVHMMAADAMVGLAGCASSSGPRSSPELQEFDGVSTQICKELVQTPRVSTFKQSPRSCWGADACHTGTEGNLFLFFNFFSLFCEGAHRNRLFGGRCSS